MRLPTLRSLVVAIAVPALLVACSATETTAPSDDPTLVGSLSVSVDANAGGLGYFGTLTVSNRGIEDAFFAPCTTFYERQVGGQWTRLDVSERVCIEIAYRALPGTEMELQMTAPPGAASGTYRVAVEFQSEYAQRFATIHSNAFVSPW